MTAVAPAFLDFIGDAKLIIHNAAFDMKFLNAELLASLNELAGSEANVATGYHAIEFLLWGQDLNDTGPGAGR